jgi:hypothetical protein
VFWKILDLKSDCVAQMGNGAKHPFSRGVKICLKKRVKENIENFQCMK